MVERELKVAYWELHDGFEAGPRTSLANDAVVLSNICKGAAATPAAEGLCVRYVGRGCENYRIGGRGYRLEAGQVMIAPQEEGAECEIRTGDRSGTLGVCTLLRGATAELDWAFGPLILGAGCSPMGAMLDTSAHKLWKAAGSKDQVAQQLVAGLRDGLPALADTVLSRVANVESARPSTRFEAVRRATLAQAYLHSKTDCAIELNELSGVIGISPFRLLSAFQQCFGETPAAYHRKLRLTLALEEARRRDMPICAVADEFGFAGASGFSHAYRRAFGRSPVWTKSN